MVTRLTNARWHISGNDVTNFVFKCSSGSWFVFNVHSRHEFDKVPKKKVKWCIPKITCESCGEVSFGLNKFVNKIGLQISQEITHHLYFRTSSGRVHPVDENLNHQCQYILIADHTRIKEKPAQFKYIVSFLLKHTLYMRISHARWRKNGCISWNSRSKFRRTAQHYTHMHSQTPVANNEVNQDLNCVPTAQPNIY